MKQKARRSTDCTIARVGRRSENRSQEGWQRGITSQVLSEGQGERSHLCEDGNPKSTRAAAFQSKVPGTMLPPMDLLLGVSGKWSACG